MCSHNTRYFLLLLVSIVLVFSSFSATAATFNLITGSSFIGRVTGGSVGDYYWEGGVLDANLSDLACCPPGTTGLNTIGAATFVQNYDNLINFNPLSQGQQVGSNVSGPVIIGNNVLTSSDRDIELIGFGDGLLGAGFASSQVGMNTVTWNYDNSISYSNFITTDGTYTYTANPQIAIYLINGQDPATIVNNLNPGVFDLPNVFLVDVDPQRLIAHFNYMMTQVDPNWTVMTFEIADYAAVSGDPVNFPPFEGLSFSYYVSTDQDAVPSQIVSTTIVSSLLPVSRSVQVGQTATVFAAVTNVAAQTATGCNVGLDSSVTSTFSYQTTDAMNNPIGSPDTPVDIPSNSTQNFVLSFTPSAPFTPTDVVLDFACTNSAGAAASIVGLNTLLLSAEATPVPDIIGLTTVVDLQVVNGGPTTLFAVGSSNVGATADITVSVDDGGAGLPLALSVCQTNAMGACMGTAASAVNLNYTGNSTASFAIFVQATGAIAADPAYNRIFIRFTDSGGTVRGATSTAVRAQ